MTKLHDAVAALITLRGWRRRGAALLFGVLATLALPPVHIIPLLWISLPVLVLLIDSSPRPRGAFADGWWWGFGHFSAGFYWVGYAMLVDPLRFGWMIPVAVFGLGYQRRCVQLSSRDVAVERHHRDGPTLDAAVLEDWQWDLPAAQCHCQLFVRRHWRVAERSNLRRLCKHLVVERCGVVRR